MRFLNLSASILLVGLVLAGCGPDKKLYEVNDANCHPQHLKSLPDDAARAELAGKCIRRGEYSKSPAKSW
ncbi:hypothetical protein D3C85_1813120 [compost metagenome]